MNPIEKAFAVWPQIEPTLRVPHTDREYRASLRDDVWDCFVETG